MIANIAFRKHPIVPPDCFILCNMEDFLLVEPNKILCFVNGDKEVISIMRDPSTFLKKIHEMQGRGEIPSSV